MENAYASGICVMFIEGCNDPGYAQTEEDVDGVAARDVTNGCVSRVFVHCRYFTGKSVRQGSSQGNWNRVCEMLRVGNWKTVESFWTKKNWKETVSNKGWIVPNVMAVTESLMPSSNPRILAISPIIAVTIAITPRETQKHNQPPAMWAGGTQANRTWDVEVSFRL